MTRRIGATVAAILAATTFGYGPAPVASGEPPVTCDVKGSINGVPATDGPLDLYEPQLVRVTGTGFPPSAPLEEVFNDYRGDDIIPLESQPDGTFLEIRGVLNPEYPYPQILTHTFYDPANPEGCRDSIVFNFIGPFPAFDDISFSIFAWDIVWLKEAGLTNGCAPDLYCPENLMRRDEMAAFLDRALELPATGNDSFTDDETSTHEASINALAAAGITLGCRVDSFCPAQAVTRAQMASFLARGFTLAPSATDYFIDDERYTSHEDDINALAASGITQGCSEESPTLFCPSLRVTRGEMAAFIHRAME